MPGYAGGMTQTNRLWACDRGGMHVPLFAWPTCTTDTNSYCQHETQFGDPDSTRMYQQVKQLQRQASNIITVSDRSVVGLSMA